MSGFILSGSLVFLFSFSANSILLISSLHARSFVFFLRCFHYFRIQLRFVSSKRGGFEGGMGLRVSCGRFVGRLGLRVGLRVGWGGLEGAGRFHLGKIGYFLNESAGV